MCAGWRESPKKQGPCNQYTWVVVSRRPSGQAIDERRHNPCNSLKVGAGGTFINGDSRGRSSLDRL